MLIFNSVPQYYGILCRVHKEAQLATTAVAGAEQALPAVDNEK